MPRLGNLLGCDVQRGTVLNQTPLTGFEEFYLVTQETHELLVTQETHEQLKIAETPNFLTVNGEMLVTQETKEPLIYQ